MLGLAVLLADGNGRGGGDLHSDNPIIGPWAGDRIVIAGDYADEGKFLESETKGRKRKKKEEGPGTLYGAARRGYRDVSRQVLRALADDEYIAEDLKDTESRPMGTRVRGGLSRYDYAMLDDEAAAALERDRE